MTERLTLTAEEIEKALQQAQAQPPTPAVLTIDIDELPSETGASSPLPMRETAVARTHLRITSEDLVPQGPQATVSTELAALETLMFGLVNSARQQHLPSWLGNPHLRWHDGLATVARGHSADMLKRQYVSHDSPEGVKVAQRITQFNINYVACGENIGVVYGEASHSEQGVYAIHNAYMAQPRRLTNHRGNLLNPIWTHVGIGAVYDSQGTLILTQNFVTLITRNS